MDLKGPKHSSSRMTKRLAMTNLEPELDFDSLPPTLRRKYFSTLERLRLASGVDSTSLPKNGRIDTHHRPRISNQKSRVDSLRRSPSTFGRSKARRLRTSLFAKEDYIAAQLDAQWFLSLPPKIQRKQFSREEQVLLAGNQDTVILDAADEKLYKLGNRIKPPPQSQESLSYQTSKSSSGLTQEEEVIVDSAVDMDDATYDSFRWLDDDDSLDLSLDDYHTHIAQEANPDAQTPTQKRKPSFRRKLSINSLSFGRSSTTSYQPPQSSQSSIGPSSLQHHGHKRSVSRPLSAILTPKHDPQNSVTPIDPSAKHYQDPEARLKLRVYLASPQKFDEAVEFGFPSLTAKENVPPSTAHHSQDRTFLDDENASLSTDDADPAHRKSEGDSLPDDPAPFTPVDSAFASAKNSGIKSTSQDVSTNTTPFRGPRIIHHHKASEPYAHGSTATREMTLHMTLTRPDLRTDEASKPRTATNPPDPDALRLADLPLSDENNPVWNSLPPAVGQGKMRKMWKKIRGRTL